MYKVYLYLLVLLTLILLICLILNIVHLYTKCMYIAYIPHITTVSPNGLPYTIKQKIYNMRQNKCRVVLTCFLRTSDLQVLDEQDSCIQSVLDEKSNNIIHTVSPSTKTHNTHGASFYTVCIQQIDVMTYNVLSELQMNIPVIQNFEMGQLVCDAISNLQHENMFYGDLNMCYIVEYVPHIENTIYNIDFQIIDNTWFNINPIPHPTRYLYELYIPRQIEVFDDPSLQILNFRSPYGQKILELPPFHGTTKFNDTIINNCTVYTDDGISLWNKNGYCDINVPYTHEYVSLRFDFKCQNKPTCIYIKLYWVDINTLPQYFFISNSCDIPPQKVVCQGNWLEYRKLKSSIYGFESGCVFWSNVYNLGVDDDIYIRIPVLNTNTWSVPFRIRFATY